MKPEPVDLRIDREGRWFAEGRPVIHEKIFRLFCDSLVKEDDKYLLRIGHQENPVHVEDAPFSARRLFVENTADGEDIIHLVLSDGRVVCLDPDTITATDSQSVYCIIPDTNLEARFSREALSQLGAYLCHDSDSGFYHLDINCKRYDLWRESTDG